MNELNLVDLQDTLNLAESVANKAASQFFQDNLGGQDSMPCGFAWVYIAGYNGKKIKGNTKAGKLLKEAGVRQDYTRLFQVWNPSHFACQNVDTLEAGAVAYAEVLRQAGFDAYAGSRLD